MGGEMVMVSLGFSLDMLFLVAMGDMGGDGGS